MLTEIQSTACQSRIRRHYSLVSLDRVEVPLRHQVEHLPGQDPQHMALQIRVTII